MFLEVKGFYLVIEDGINDFFFFFLRDFGQINVPLWEKQFVTMINPDIKQN